MIYEVEGEFVISSRQRYLPGVYKTKRAANYAFRFRDGDLQALQDSVNPGGVITFGMLQELRRPHTDSCDGKETRDDQP